jgi:hypothetical protein
VLLRRVFGALAALEVGESPKGLIDFAQLREIVGFDDYDTELARYKDS